MRTPPLKILKSKRYKRTERTLLFIIWNIPLVVAIQSEMSCCCLCSVLGFFVGAIACLLVWIWSTPKAKKIVGVYSLPTRTYWLKVIFFYIVVTLRRWKNEKKTVNTGAPVGYGVKSRSRIEDMECPQPLSDHPKAIDAVYFNGANKDGFYMVMATARRPKGVINGSLYLRVPGVGTLELPRMPDTLIFGAGKGFEAEGLCITPVEPMKKWQLRYKGPMKLNGETSKKFDVLLNLTWTSNSEYFDFDTDMNSWALSRSIARETWSRQYFKDLESAHQTHYEHMGKLNGVVTIDGKEFTVSLDSLRDHSYGNKREWKLIHRYGLHMLHTESGLSLNVGIVSQPITSSVLELGYISTPEEGKAAVSYVDFPLWQHGEGGTAPTDYAFSFVADDKTYYVEVVVVNSPIFYIGWEWETKVVERFVICRVNGQHGWGIAEWVYRHHDGRPEEYLNKDPEWTKSLNKG